MTADDLRGNLAFLAAALRGSKGAPPESLARFARAHSVAEILDWLAGPPLPEAFRETLVLSDVEGMAYQEIAGILGVPIGTVKSRLFRARQLLQGKLYKYAVEMGYIKGSPA